MPFLVANTIDISLGGLTRNSERAKLIEYTRPLHTEVMGVLTTDKVKIASYTELNDAKYTLADVRGSWTIDWIKENLPKAKIEVVDNNADVVRTVAQGRADAIVEMLDFFTAFTKDHTNVTWQVLPNKIDIGWDCLGVQKGNYALRDVFNIALYKLHSLGRHRRAVEEVLRHGAAREGSGAALLLIRVVAGGRSMAPARGISEP